MVGKVSDEQIYLLGKHESRKIILLGFPEFLISLEISVVSCDLLNQTNEFEYAIGGNFAAAGKTKSRDAEHGGGRNRSRVWQHRGNICALSHHGKVALIKWADDVRTISAVIFKMCIGRSGRYGNGKSADRFRRHWSRALAGDI